MTAGTLCAALLAAAGPARADWTGPRDIVHGTANTLEQGELIIGVLTPAIYGATDSITLIVHPVNWLLLSPNAGLRVRILDTEPARIALQMEASGTILGGSSTARDDPMPLWHVKAGSVVTFDVGAGVMLSAGCGYQGDFDPEDHSLTFQAAAGWLITQSHLVLLQGGIHYSVPGDAPKSEQLSVMYAHAWERARLGVGVAVGAFPVVRVDRMAAEARAWPLLDFWARF